MRSEIRPLTGLRGLAACWVMVGHYMGGLPTAPLTHTIISHMYVAVDLFMILSGFVLAMTYGPQFEPPFSPKVYLRFLKHRLARLYPLYALVTAGCLIMMEMGIGDNCSTRTLPAVVLNFLMMQAWWWPDDSISGTGWTLSIEWGVNLLLPFFVFLLLQPSRLRENISIGTAILGLIVTALTNGQTDGARPAIGAMDWYYAPDSLIRCTVEFMLGIYLWRLRDRVSGCAFLGRTPVLAALLVLMAISTVFAELDLLFVGLSGLLVLGFSFEQSRLAAWFGSSIPNWLGRISFSVYLLHLAILPLRALVVGRLTGVAPTDFYFVSSVPQALICMAVVLAVSTMSHKWLERPAQRWIRGFSG